MPRITCLIAAILVLESLAIADDVGQLIRASCVDCHDATTRSGQLDLTSLALNPADPATRKSGSASTTGFRPVKCHQRTATRSGQKTDELSSTASAERSRRPRKRRKSRRDAPPAGVSTGRNMSTHSGTFSMLPGCRSAPCCRKTRWPSATTGWAMHSTSPMCRSPALSMPPNSRSMRSSSIRPRSPSPLFAATTPATSGRLRGSSRSLSSIPRPNGPLFPSSERRDSRKSAGSSVSHRGIGQL